MANASLHQQKLIDFLKKGSSYPHQPEAIEIIQTHASILAMAPPFVYKFKKQLDFGFMDFRTLESRRDNCERELKLNRRLCAGIYLEVLPLYESQDQLSFSSEGKIIDYGLKMRQLPQGYFLHQQLEKGQLSTVMLEQVLQHLTSFYQQAAEDSSIARFGELSQLRQNSDENFKSLREMQNDLIAPEALQAIEEASRHFYDHREALFQKRVAEGRIKDCHGDLRLEHIHLQDGKVCIFDCIEFNDRFRYIDIAADLAFLAMDLDFSGSPGLAAFVSKRMAELLQDQDMLQLMDFYKSYRACVRAKVEGIRARQAAQSEDEKKQHRDKVKRYMQLALQYSFLGSSPTVIVLCGRIGSGKSTMAKKLSELLGLPYASSDIIRKRSSAAALHKRTEEEEKAMLYSEEKTNEVYGQLLNHALETLKKGSSIVLDATFAKKERRANFMAAMEQEQRSYYFVEASAGDAAIRERLKKRERQPQVSDARLEDFNILSKAFEPLHEIPPQHYFKVNTETSPEKSIRHCVKTLAEKAQR
jgi:aminoglycoside phosphotransferase family enzyme/predicted kinase